MGSQTPSREPWGARVLPRSSEPARDASSGPGRCVCWEGSHAGTVPSSSPGWAGCLGSFPSITGLPEEHREWAPCRSLLLRKERIIPGKRQFCLICVSFLVFLWQPIKRIIRLKGRGQVIAGAAEVCLAYRCLLGEEREGSEPGPVQNMSLLRFHHQIELSGTFQKRWLGSRGCSILFRRAGDSHNSIFSRGFQGTCLPALPTKPVITSALLSALSGADFSGEAPQERRRHC